MKIVDDIFREMARFHREHSDDPDLLELGQEEARDFREALQLLASVQGRPPVSSVEGVQFHGMSVRVRPISRLLRVSRSLVLHQ